MTLREVRDRLNSLLVRYFRGATVMWSKTNMTAPRYPALYVETGNVQRPIQPETVVIDGTVADIYPSTVQVTLNLCTKGAQIVQEGMTNIYENTAVNDLLAFVNFVNSETVKNWSYENDIAIRIEGPVQDLTGITNDTKWRYRARAELSLSFTEMTVGAAAVLSERSIKPDGTITPIWEETPSGGGSPELANEDTGYFTKVEIEYGIDQKEP